MKELGMSLSVIERLTPKRISEYVVIVSEIAQISKEKMEAASHA